MIFSKKVAHGVNSLKLSDVQVTRVLSHRHLGLQLTHNLDWKEQVSIMCLKANRKLSVLRQVKQLQRSTLDVLYKTTVRSVIDYGILVYYHSLTQADKNRIDKLQYNASKLVSSTLHYTSRIKIEQELIGMGVNLKTGRIFRFNPFPKNSL